MPRLRIQTASLAIGLLIASGVSSREAQPLADNPVLEARVMAIAEELRCLVCQNETIAASQADLAVDLRKQIRAKLVQGKSEQEIRDFMVQRYGDFVLYRPPLQASTLLLWGGPFVLLALAVAAMAVQIRRRRNPQQDAALTLAESEQARRLLDKGIGPP